jgi:fucose 4-O-acetylase-like acetyltransferase
MRPYLSKKLILITNIGQNTWPIFLLHGFVIKVIPLYFPYLVDSPWRVILLSFALVILVGNKFFNRAVYYTCFSWLEKYATNTTYGGTVR